MTDAGDTLRAGLRKMSEEYSDGLRIETRRRILASALRSVPARRAGSPWSMIPRMAAAAAVLAVLALPAFRMVPTGSSTGEGTPVRDLEVTAKGNEVIVTWRDGDRPHRVIRATNREELARLADLPGEVVTGERWVDTRPTDAAVVYYFVK